MLDRKALRCCAFGQCGWPGGLCLLQECDSCSQPSPVGIHEQTVCECACRACLHTSRGPTAERSNLLCPLCRMYTKFP